MREQHNRRTDKLKVVTAVIAGVAAGAVRVIATWLLDHLTAYH
jgi:hypothetical protein